MFVDDVSMRLALEALERARSACRSRTLARSMAVEQGGPGEARVTVPHYWAVYYHDGRGPIRARPGHYLVYFKDLADDPRVDGGASFPERASDIKRLSRSDFYRYLRAGKIVVTKRVGPAAGNKFFESPTVRQMAQVASGTVPALFSDYVRSQMGADLNVDLEVTL